MYLDYSYILLVFLSGLLVGFAAGIRVVLRIVQVSRNAGPTMIAPSMPTMPMQMTAQYPILFAARAEEVDVLESKAIEPPHIRRRR